MNLQKDKIQEKISKLVAEINKWNNEYYNLDNPTVSDQTYDKALRELEELEQKYPDLILEDSPTQKIGGFASNKFQKYTHKKPMLSLAKAYTFEEIEKFFENAQKLAIGETLSYSLEPKIDGLSIALFYENGQLIRAVTRGDGKIGEDVTENIYQIKSIPKQIDYKNELEVRGEVYLSKSVFQEINNNLEEQGLKTFSNPRNAASGTLRQLDAKIVKRRKLDAFLYQIVDPEFHNLETQELALEFLRKHKFPLNNYHNIAKSLDEIINNIEEFGKIKNDLDYECDGFVIKINQFFLYEKLGYTAKFPRYAIAYKYESESANTEIKDIIATVGRTGKITYVANLKPVNLNQTTVSNATLHNYEFIKDMEINIGDIVKIIKSGEIIPKVIELVAKKTDSIFPKVTNCPSCNSVLVHVDNLVDQFCTNEDCPSKIVKKLIHFVSRNAMNMQVIGESNVELFYNLGIVKKVTDFYQLHNYKELLLSQPTYKDKKVNNILDSIENSKNVSFAKTLFALGIKHIGSQVAELIAQKVGSFQELLDLNLDSLTLIDTIGDKIVSSIKEFISKDENKAIMLELDQILNYQKVDSSNLLSGKTFVITGTLSKERNYFKDLILQNGGKVSSSVSSKTSFLLAGENAGSKKEKALENGVAIIDEEAFNEMIK